MKSLRWLSVLLLGCILLGCSQGGTRRLYLRYIPAKDFPALQEKIGMNLAVPPFKDDRPDTRIIGFLAPLTGSYIYYRSEPFPLEKAIQDSLSDILSPLGIKTLPVSGWDGQPSSLRDWKPTPSLWSKSRNSGSRATQPCWEQISRHPSNSLSIWV